MRRLLSILPLLLVTMLVASPTAGAAVVHSEFGAFAHGVLQHTVLDYDSTAKTITVDATQTRNDSVDQDVPVRDVITLTLPNGASRLFNFGSAVATLADGVTTVDPLVAPSDGQPGILNKGPQTFNVPGGLRISANRAALIEFGTDFVPAGFTG
jgi:hypothetical protein